MTEFQIFIVATSIVDALIIIYMLSRVNVANSIEKKEFKTKRKKDYSVTIPKKLRVIKNK